MSIILDKVNYVYSEKTAYEAQALKDINLQIKDGEFIGIIGHTGSGKSTLIQHLNVLLPGAFIIMAGTFMKMIMIKNNCAARSGWYFSTQSINCLTPLFSRTYVLARAT